MATTSASIVRQDLICRLDFSSAVSSEKFPNITRPRTISISLQPNHLAKSYRIIAEIIDVLENNATYTNMLPKCEPQLGKRGLYGAIGGDKDAAAANMAMLWILNLSDGQHSLLDIAERGDLSFSVIWNTAERLREHGLLKGGPDGR